MMISGRAGKETIDRIENHPPSQSDLISYGLYLLRTVESNLKEARTFIHAVRPEPKEEEQLPF